MFCNETNYIFVGHCAGAIELNGSITFGIIFLEAEDNSIHQLVKVLNRRARPLVGSRAVFK